MKRFKLLVSALLMIFCVVSCNVVREQAAQGVENAVRDELSKQLPADKQAAFIDQWATDKKAALLTAAEILGVDKLAAIIEQQDKTIADALRRDGIDAIKDQWPGFSVALIAAIWGAIAKRSQNKWVRVGSTLITGIQDFLKKDATGNKELLSAIKTKAENSKVDELLKSTVTEVLAAHGETRIKVS